MFVRIKTGQLQQQVDSPGLTVNGNSHAGSILEICSPSSDDSIAMFISVSDIARRIDDCSADKNGTTAATS
ncbi:hypothetical protein M405DRAFT_812131, partial [Rhizopogon salebrosus TDB-379]